MTGGGERLDGGNAGGAVRVGDTVRRGVGPWTPAVHALLRHLAGAGVPGVPTPLGVDEHGREVLRYLPGRTVGSARPWPAWVHSDDALVQVGRWLRVCHDAVAAFIPPDGAVWRMGEAWQPGQIICHNDAAPYNAVWRETGLVGFIDWDFAGPGTPEWDLAFVAFSWVPLHARHVVAGEGFHAFADRSRRLRLLLDAYGWSGETEVMLDLVRARVRASIDGICRLAAQGEPPFAQLLARGAVDDLETALTELADDAPTWPAQKPTHPAPSDG